MFTVLPILYCLFSCVVDVVFSSIMMNLIIRYCIMYSLSSTSTLYFKSSERMRLLISNSLQQTFNFFIDVFQCLKGGDEFLNDRCDELLYKFLRIGGSFISNQVDEG